MSGAPAGVVETPDVAGARRIDALDWTAVGRDLDGYGCAVLPRILAPVECAAIAGDYDTDRFTL